jgi:hypothetical protein
MEKSYRYFECWKCGNKIKTNGNGKDIPCMEYAWCRTSNICGGSYEIEITEDIFLEEVKKNKIKNE